MKTTVLITGICLMLSGLNLTAQSNRVNHNNQDIFLSGMNLAWVNFANDLTSFNESEFTRALDEISSAGGNSLRWWLHINGTASPQFTDGMVSGITNEEIQSMKLGLDLAAERGMGIVMCLWSFDMLQSGLSAAVQERNRNLVMDSLHTVAYIYHALTPIIDSLSNHPAVICWEMFNEPEGMSAQFGWTPVRVDMADIQQFINLVGGAIHRLNPEAKVSNGSWSFQAATDAGSGNKNYYSDEELMAAGGDPDGTMDFYMVHYYDHFPTSRSPFHHPASFWELDKPLVIGEFSANGPFEGISPVEAYNYLYDNGYAGALSWTWTGHDGNGDVTDVEPAMQDLYNLHGEDIIITYEGIDINYYPRLAHPIPDTAIERGSGLIGYVNLRDFFDDQEDGKDLFYSITGQTDTAIAKVTLVSDSLVNILVNDTTGIAVVFAMATDSGGKSRIGEFAVSVFDTNSIDRAMFRKTVASSRESDALRPLYAVDGDPETRWSSVYYDGEWIQVELEKPRIIREVDLVWETAYGESYELLISDDGLSWEPVFSEMYGDGGRDLILFETPEAFRYIRMNGISRATQWGFSLYSFELYEEAITINTVPFIRELPDTVFAETNKLMKYVVEPIFNDTTPGDQLVYEAVVTLPDWLSFINPLSQDAATIQGYPTADELGSYTITIRGIDRFGAAAEASFVIDVYEAPDALEDPFTEGFRVYPNPTQGILNIELKSGLEISKLQVSDLQGRTLKIMGKDEAAPCMQIDMNDLQSGMYILVLERNGFTCSERIVKY